MFKAVIRRILSVVKVVFRRFFSIVLSVMLVFSTSGVTECFAENVSHEEIPAEETVSVESINVGEEPGSDGDTVSSDEKPESEGDTVSSDESGDKEDTESPDGSGSEEDPPADDTASGGYDLSEDNKKPANTVSSDDTTSVSADTILPVVENGREPEMLGVDGGGTLAYESYHIRQDGGQGRVVYRYYKKENGKYSLFIGTSNVGNSYVSKWKIDDPSIEEYNGNPVENSFDNLIKNVDEVVGFGSQIVEIPESAFNNSQGNWNNLKAVRFEGESAGSGCSITEIGKQAFYNCIGLKYVTGKSSVYSIDEWAFSGCSELRNIYLPETLVDVKAYAFDGCTSLQGLCFLNTDSSLGIGDYAFRDCKKLQYITLPKKVDYQIGEDSFYRVSINLDNNIHLKIYYNGTYYNNTSVKSNYAFAKEIINRGHYTKGDYSEIYNNMTAGIKGYIGSEETDCLYEMTTDKKTVTLSGSGKMVNFASNAMYPWGSSVTSLNFSSYPGSIGTNAFSGCSNLTALDLGTGNYSIGNNAFSNCKITNLTYGGQTLGSNVFSGADNFARTGDNITPKATLNIKMGDKSLNSGVFNGNKNIKTINIESIKDINSSAFKDCTGISTLKITKAGTIYGYAFQNCTSINDPTLGYGSGSITEIKKYAFKDCTGITTFNSGRTVTLDDNILSGCKYLTSFTVGPLTTYISPLINENKNSITTLSVDSGNKKYASINNKCITYNKDGDLTIRVAVNSLTTIPSGVASIGAYAFSSLNMVSITITDGVKKIRNDAFEDCTNLKTVIFPATLTSIEGWAFNNCNSLSTIIYNGSEYQWDNNLTIVNNYNDPITKDKVQWKFSEGYLDNN
ncbi:MAG: leucine-rich repeat protein, partial [Lachnospiraceae bacterium]|nr:leucine-rich repeat protein [Lachnospiraceae bacterium]